ncbi:MAG: DUF1501 domain-containing protein [Gemmataceae bacterium]
MFTRRDILARAGTGLGMLGLAGLLADDACAADSLNPLAPKKPPLPAKAKHVIHVYLNGGPSQMDTFDPKPALQKYNGKPLPNGNLTTERATGAALGTSFPIKKYGKAGIDATDLFDKTLTAHADEMCFIRSMHANTPNHEQSMRLMNCGDERLSRPSYGAWLTYGLGTENANLPGFVVLCPGLPVADVSNWRSAFLPGAFQGTHVDTRKTKAADLIENVVNGSLGKADQRRQLDALAELNRKHQQTRAEDAALEARIQSFELAYRMQSEATDAFDVTRETKAVREKYGETIHGRQLLIARRLVERGVRVVQCYHGDVQPWDSHNNIAGEHRNLANQIDGPLAALLADLKQRDLLKETLVVIGGEFGRTPAVELAGGKPAMGRDHNHWGFTVALAGGGVKGGMVVGATDDFGYKAVENRVHVHDLHATMLHLLGFDHEKLTYRYAGRDFRLTDVHGRVVKDVLA